MPQLDLFIFTSQIFTTTLLFWFSYILFSRRQLLRMSFILKYRKGKNLHMLRVIDILAYNYYMRRIDQTTAVYNDLGTVAFSSKLDRMFINYNVDTFVTYAKLIYIYVKYEPIESNYAMGKYIIEEERLNNL